MLPTFPSSSFLLLLLFLLAGPALLTTSVSQELQVGGQRTQRDTKQDSIKVVISEGCTTQDESSDGSQGGKEIDMVPGSPLVLTHKIQLIPSVSGSGSGSCGCETDFAALRERLERLEREVSVLREKCGGAEGGGCCTSKESKGAGCSIKPEGDECPNECSDQGRCVEGKCVCFPGFSGLDCSNSNCPGNCNDNGRCVNGECVCDPGFTGTDCSQRHCPDNCNNRGRCVKGRCVCNSGFTGPSCSDESCPGNCNKRGRCVNGQCVCNPGFIGPDCSKRGCLNNCNNHGRCVNGKCVCNSGFTGADCSQISCPGNCNNRGRCVNGQCVCNGGFTGSDCSEISCPGNCNNRGRCVNGQCVCDDGFTGSDCTERTCPNDCNNHGRCVNGECVCDSSFTGEDCSDISCPGNCNNRGRCVNGQCVCDDGFTGQDCSEISCPGNCNNRGRCVNGQCVCNNGFTGQDCSEKACPNNCSKRGKCVNGNCVCNVGFAGPECAAKGCPNNCNNKGRCVKGRCVCQRGFTGPDCSQCETGMTGPNCDTVMSGVSQLSTREITETSVTLVWTPPPVQYETYHITFTSQKESDQKITVQVPGSLTNFTQTGLAAGQEYTVTITGDIDGRRGANSSTTFMTLISGPKNLQVVKTTSTTAVVQWEPSQGEIDRYHMTVSPSDGAGRSQGISIPSGRNSAHIQHLEAGRLYDIILVAEKGTSRSEPATTQTVPGNTFPKVTMASVTTQVTPAPGQEVGNRDQQFNPLPEKQAFDQQERKEDGSHGDSVKVGDALGLNQEPSATVIAKTKPPVNRKDSAKLAKRPILPKKPNILNYLRFNASRDVPGVRKFGPVILKQSPVGEKKKVSFAVKKPKPSAPSVRDRTIALTVRHPSALTTESRGDKNPAIMSGTDSETNSEKQFRADGSQKQPDVDAAARGSHTDPMSLEPTGTSQSQEKKCMNKIKVTHIRLPLKDRGSGCRADRNMLEGKSTSDSHQGSSETDNTQLKNNNPDLKLLLTERNYSEDPLHKLLTDTYDRMNITTFSVHLSKPADLSVDAATTRKQILKGLKPLSPLSSSSSAQSTVQSSSSSPHSSSLSPSSSSSSASVESRSLISSSPSTVAPSSSSLTYLISSSPPSSSSSSPEKSDPVESNEPDVSADKHTKTITSAASSEYPKVPSREGSIPYVFRRTPAKGGYIRRPRPNIGPYQNRTRLSLKTPYHSASPLNLIPKRETVTPTSGVALLQSSSFSEESSSVEVNTPMTDTSTDKDEAIIIPGTEQNRKKMPTERRKLPVRHPLKGIHLRRPFPNIRPFRNQTRPNLRVGTRPAQLLNPSTESSTESISSTESQDSSLPSSSPKEKFYPAEGTAPGVEDPEGRVVVRLPTKVNQMRDNLINSSDHPTSKVSFSRPPHPYVGPFQNRTRTNLRPPQPPHRSSLREVPTRNLNGSSGITSGSLTIQRAKENTPEILDNQSGEQGDNNPIQEVQIRQSESQDTAGIIDLDGHDTTVRPQTNQLEKRDNDLTQTIKSAEEETQTPESNSDSNIHKKRVIATKNTGTAIRRPIIKQPSSDPRTSRPVIFSKRRSSVRRITGQSHTQMRNIGGNQRGEDQKTNQTAKPEFYSNTEQTRSGGSKSPTQSDVSSSGVTREPLNNVGVTNRTSDGFTVIWDAPEAKYKNFVVTMKEDGKDEELKEKESRKKWEEDSEKEYSKKDEERLTKPAKEAEPENGNIEDENRLPESVTQISTIQSIKPATERDKTFKKVVPGSARSFQFEDLPPQTEYTVTLLGKSPGLLSRLHKLVISTGPEPPSNIIFSELTENSLTVSWTKPKRPVSGFKVTYTHNKEDEPVSVSVDSNNSSLSLSKLTPGSSYTVSVISILGLDESDPIKDSVMTLPDPPKDLQAVNITDTKALLLWRPALAAIDRYTIVYGSGNGPAVRITVSGNAAEQQLSGLEGSTTYTVTITSELGSLKSSEAKTSFTTTSGSRRDGDGPGDLKASQVTPRTALLSWKPPSKPVGRYRLTYQTEGQDMKEVIVDATATEYNLTKLHPGSKYTVQLQVEGGGGRYIPAISTDFTTGILQFPFPTDCSQELLNGVRTSGEVEIFPQGKLGTPLKVYCDMETDGGGWTVFQRRKDGSVDFFRGWKDYAKGFGDLSGEFWLGLDSLHSLTSATRMSLRVDLRDGDTSVFAQYSTFEVAKRNYRLTVGGYSGSAGDSLSYHNNGVFSTKDRDPALFITRCAMSYRGGWWYKNCHEANLNGLYGIDVKHQGLIWTAWKGKEFSVPFTEMKMRPAAFSPPTRG